MRKGKVGVKYVRMNPSGEEEEEMLDVWVMVN